MSSWPKGRAESRSRAARRSRACPYRAAHERAARRIGTPRARPHLSLAAIQSPPEQLITRDAPAQWQMRRPRAAKHGFFALHETTLRRGAAACVAEKRSPFPERVATTPRAATSTAAKRRRGFRYLHASETSHPRQRLTVRRSLGLPRLQITARRSDARSQHLGLQRKLRAPDPHAIDSYLRNGGIAALSFVHSRRAR